MALAKLSTIVHFCKTAGGFSGTGFVETTTVCGTVNRGEELLFTYNWAEVTCKKCLAGHQSREGKKVTYTEKKLKEFRKDLKEATKQLADYSKKPFYEAGSEFEVRYLRNLQHEIDTLGKKITELEAELQAE